PVGAKPLQRALHAGDQVMARGAHVVRAVARAQGELGRDDRALAAALQRGAEDFLRSAIRIDVRAVEQVGAGIEANIDKSLRLGCIGAAPGAEQRALAAKGAGAEAESRHLEAGTAEKVVVHDESS